MIIFTYILVAVIAFILGVVAGSYSTHTEGSLAVQNRLEDE